MDHKENLKNIVDQMNLLHLNLVPKSFKIFFTQASLYQYLYINFLQSNLFDKFSLDIHLYRINSI